MALLLEPIVGHLLSRYKETVTEGLDKIKTNARKDSTFAALLISNEQALGTLLELPSRGMADYLEPTLVTCLALLQASATNPGTQSSLVRTLCRSALMFTIRNKLSALSDATLPTVISALQLMSAIAALAPKMLLSRFNNEVPLQLACFRLNLTYAQRRVRNARVPLLLNLALTRHASTMVHVVCSHGYLTQILEDAAHLLQEESPEALQVAKQVLQLIDTQFVSSRAIRKEKKRDVLMGQRNIFRLLVKALEIDSVAADVSRLLRRIIAEFVESPSDYSTVRLDADDRGMPNFILFTILRQLRPKNSDEVARLLVFILNVAPDLIRPYFARVSSHLTEETNSKAGASRIVVTAATVNVLTRSFLAPLPYHLASQRARLEPTPSSATTFFTLSPQNIADEICPQWLGEFVHRMINSSTNLLTLVWAMQVTQAALMRSKAVLTAVRGIQAQRGAKVATSGAAEAVNSNEASPMDAVDWHAYNAASLTALATGLPRREEFWHRVTQQLHSILLVPTEQAKDEKKDSAAAGDSAAGLMKMSVKDAKTYLKGQFVMQRMMALMELYTDVFGLRVSWLTAVPSFLPHFTSTTHAISEALRRNNDILAQWSPQSISALCTLLTSNLQRGVPSTRMHHVTLTNPKGGITEWPLLLSLLLWGKKRLTALRGAAPDRHTLQALGWVNKTVLWTVHSVTVCFACEVEEAFLWIMSLTEETIPMFVHLINSMLQRSLSKAADRVALDVLAGQTGAVVSSARHFIARQDEKSALAASAASGDAPSAAPTSASTNTSKKLALFSGGDKQHQKHQAPNKSNQPQFDFWVLDMQDHFSTFKTVVDTVEKQWPRRREVFNNFFAPLITEGKEAGRGLAAYDKQVSLVRSVLGVDEQTEFIKPPHELYMAFCQTLESPITPKEEETYIHDQIRDKDRSVSASLRHVTDLLLPKTLDRFAGEWLSSSCLCWDVAGAMLRGLRDDYEDTVTLAESFSLRLLRHLHTYHKALGQWLHLSEYMPAISDAQKRNRIAVNQPRMNDSDGMGFWTLLLVVTHVVLQRSGTAGRTEDGSNSTKPAMKSSKREGDAAPLIEADVLESIGTIIVKSYTGSISIVDRMQYGVLLNLHSLQAHAGSKNGIATDAEKSHGGDNENDEDGDDGDSATGEDKSDDDNNDNEAAEPERNLKGPHHKLNAGGRGGAQKRGRQDRSGSKKKKDFEGVWLRDCSVPLPLARNRFLVQDIAPAPHVTVEVDVLASIVDSWTEQEVNQMALQCPARLSNQVFVPNPTMKRGEGKGAASHRTLDMSYTLLRSVFPECTRRNDWSLVSIEELVDVSVLDPRFLLPLLQAVGAVLAQNPAASASQRYLLSKAFPYVVRALSMTDPALRRYAASILSLTHGLSPQRMLLFNFVRLTLIHVTQRHEGRTSHPARIEKARVVPRLPAVYSAFVVLAQRSLHDVDSRLHNHVVNYLINPEMFAFHDSVPLKELLVSFPLGCITTPLMLKKQEELQRSGGDRSGIAHASSQEVQTQLQQDAPEHLNFILSILQYGCEAGGDVPLFTGSSGAIAAQQHQQQQSFAHSPFLGINCLTALLQLATMASASTELRLAVLQTLHRVLTTSTDVSEAFLGANSRINGGLLSALVALVRQLCLEYGAGTMAAVYGDGGTGALFNSKSHRFGDAVFIIAVRILADVLPAAQRVCTAVELRQAKQHITHICQLVRQSGATAKVTLDSMQRLFNLSNQSTTSNSAAFTPIALNSNNNKSLRPKRNEH